MTDYKTEIIGLLKSVKRENMPSLIEWIEKSDFFTAPASTRFHGSYSGGLAEHSLNVYKCLDEMATNLSHGFQNFLYDSIIICALLHDLCKTNFYKESTRNVKNEKTGEWEKKPYYEVDDKEPYGHGEKSVMLIEKFIKLTDEEKYSIRWHMGGFDESVKGGSYAIGKAYEKYPLAVALHLADMMATYIIEKEKAK
jgi:hypothetical protein